MSKNDYLSGFLFIVFVVGVILYLSGGCGRKEEEHSTVEEGGRHSFYWDDSATASRKAEEIRNKYWDVDENGIWHRKETTARRY